MPLSKPDGIYLAETEEEREAVYRFRYQVYVEEMGRYRETADHDNRRLWEPCDDQSRIGFALENGEVVATGRFTWGGHGPLPERQIRQYDLEPFLAELPPEAIGVGERGMVTPRLRGTNLLLRMLQHSLAFVNENRIQLTFGNCEPHLLNLYLGLGHRTYAKRNVNSPEAGYLIPIMFVPEDVAYLRNLNSPLVHYVKDFGEDARIPACVQRIMTDGSAVMSSRLTSSEAYWGRVYGALSELESNRISAFDGMGEDDASRCLAKSNIIECGAGDRVLKKGGVARNIFVLLDGTLEVRDGDRLVRVLSKGDVFGEMAFLLEQPRSMDLYAATDGVRVLSLSESELHQMIEGEPGVAAHLLLNISKMLCMRLLKTA